MELFLLLNWFYYWVASVKQISLVGFLAIKWDKIWAIQELFQHESIIILKPFFAHFSKMIWSWILLKYICLTNLERIACRKFLLRVMHFNYAFLGIHIQINDINPASSFWCYTTAYRSKGCLLHVVYNALGCKTSLILLFIYFIPSLLSQEILVSSVKIIWFHCFTVFLTWILAQFNFLNLRWRDKNIFL